MSNKHILLFRARNLLEIDPHYQVVEDEKQYAKIKAFRDELPHLKAVVMYGGKTDWRLSWPEHMTLRDKVQYKLQALIDYCNEMISTLLFVGLKVEIVRAYFGRLREW